MDGDMLVGTSDKCPADASDDASRDFKRARTAKAGKARRCCKRPKEMQDFSRNQWRMDDPLCLQCAEKGKKQKQGGATAEEEPENKACRRCKQSKGKRRLSQSQWETNDPLCLPCAEKGKKQKQNKDDPLAGMTRKCRCCEREKEEKRFSQTEWKKELSLCLRCTEKGKQQKQGVDVNINSFGPRKVCRCCKKEKREEGFSPNEWKKEQPLCARCSEKGKAQKGATSVDTLNHEGQSIHIMLAKKEGMEAKLLPMVTACAPAAAPRRAIGDR